MTFAVNVGRPVNGGAVLANEDRAVDADVVEGHFGRTSDAGRVIQFAQIANVELSVSDPPSDSAFEVADKGTGQYEVRLAAAMTVDIEILTLTATATCIPGGVRICVDPAAVVPVTVAFNRIVNEVQGGAEWTFDPDTTRTIPLALPSEYNRNNADNAPGRSFTVVADNYPLETKSDVPSNEASCLALGGRTTTDGAVNICADYTFSNSEARTDAGGGCALSGSTEGTQCATAFNAVRACNLDNKPALDNSRCAAEACLGGKHAIGGKCPAFSSFTVDEDADQLAHNLADIANEDHREPVALGGGVYTLTVEMRHDKLLGVYTLEAMVTVNKTTLSASYGLAEGLSPTERIAAGYTGLVYTSAVTDDGAVMNPNPASVEEFEVSGGKALVINLTGNIAGGGDESRSFTLTVNHGNNNRAASYKGKEQILNLRVTALNNPIAKVPDVNSNSYENPNIFDFASAAYASGDYAGATFSESPASQDFAVNGDGNVGTQAALMPGTYAVTVEAVNSDENSSLAFLGTATLTLSLNVFVAVGAAEFVGNAAPVVRAAQGHTGAVYTLTTDTAHYRLENYAATNNSEGLDFDNGVFSIPANKAMGDTDRKITVEVDVICVSGKNSQDADICTVNEKITRLTLTLTAVPVFANRLNETAAYGDSNFEREVSRPWISVEGNAGGIGSGLSRFGIDDLNIALMNEDAPGSGKKDGFVLANGKVKFDSAAPAEPGEYTLTFHITHTGGNGIAGFVGIVPSTMSIRVDKSGAIVGVAENERIGSGDTPIYVFVPHGPQAFDASNTSPVPLFSLTVSDAGISVEIAGVTATAPPANSPYSLSISADKRALVVYRTTEALGVDDTSAALVAMLTVQATGDDAARYEAKVQPFMLRAVQFAAPELPSHQRGVSSANGDLADLAELYLFASNAAINGNDRYNDFSDAVFAKASGDNAFSVATDGKVSVTDLTVAGDYAVVVTATSSGFAGVARFTLSVTVQAPVLADAARSVELNVVAGHFGDSGDAGYTIPFILPENTQLSVKAIAVDGVAPAFVLVEKAGGAYEVRLDAGLTAGGVSVRALTLTAVVTCVPDASRTCGDPSELALTVTFKRYDYSGISTNISEEFNSGFAVAVAIPDEYSIHSTPGILNRTLSVVGSRNYPLSLTDAIAANQTSCERLGGKYDNDGGVETCVEYTYSNSEARTATGGGCVISGGGTDDYSCATAFANVRNCNTGGSTDGGNRPALNNTICSTHQCPGGFAVGGECPIASALTFRTTDDMLVYADGDEEIAPGAGVYTVEVALTHPTLLGRLIVGAVVSITKKAHAAEFGAFGGGSSATRRVAAGHTGEVYRTPATDGGVITPATESPDGFSATGGREFVIQLNQALSGGEFKTGLFTLTVNYGNANRARNYDGIQHSFNLLVTALGNPIPTIPNASSSNYNNANIYDFGAQQYAEGAYGEATFTEFGDSPDLLVTGDGVVGTQRGLAPGQYGITVEAVDSRGASLGFAGRAALTLSLTVTAPEGASEYIGNLESVVRVARGHTGGVYTLTANHSYTLTNYTGDGTGDWAFADGVFSIPNGNPMGATARVMTVTVQALCPDPKVDSNGATICPGSETVAATLTLTLTAVPVNSAVVNVSPQYGDPTFSRAVALPWIPTETVFEGPALARFSAEDVNIVLDSSPVAGFVYTDSDNMVKFDQGALPEPGRYTLTFNITRTNSDATFTFAGTVKARMVVIVGVVAVGGERGIQGIPEEDRINTRVNADGERIVVFAPFGAQAFDDGAAPFITLPVADTAIAVEIVEPEALGDESQFKLSVDSSVPALVVFRTSKPLRVLGFENVTAEIVDITFTVRATGDNANRYEPNVQRLFMRAAQFVEPVVPLVERADTDADGVVADLSEIAVGRNGEEYLGKTTYGDFFMFEDDDNDPGTPEVRAGGVTFTETGPVAGFSVSADGIVSVTGLNITGSYTYTVRATSDAFTGVALFTVSVEVGKSGGIKFHNQDVVVGGDILIGGDVIVNSDGLSITTEIKESDKVAGTPDALLRVNMVYHGERRGLHWIYGDKYYKTEGQVKNDTPDNGLDGGLDNDWYSKRICEEFGNKDGSAEWRLPTLIEMAGGVLPGSVGSETDFTALVAGTGVGRGLSMFELNGPRDTTGIDTVNLTAKPVNNDDAAALAEHFLSNGSKVPFEQLGYFAGVFNAATDDTRGSPAHVYYTNDQVRVSDAAQKGRVVCVHDTTGYDKTAVWAELSVDDGTPGSDANSGAYRIVTPPITLSVVGVTATADLKVGLGVFTVRGEMAPQAVADETVVSNLSIELQDSQNVFTVSPVAVSGGGVKLEVSVPSDAASIPDTGIYTLSVTFAPTGDYVGFAQRDFEKTSFGAVDKVQFDVVRLTVNWTKPAVALGESFEFGDTTIDSADGVAVVTVTSRVYGGAAEGVEMKYYGDVGGLRVMYSTKNPFTPVDSSGDGYGPHLCAAGGANWRNPTLTELAMLLTGPAATNLTLTVRNSGRTGSGMRQSAGMPGQTSVDAEDLSLTFPAVTDAKNGMIAALTSDYTFDAGKFHVGSGLFDNAGEAMGLIFDVSTPDQAEMDDFVGAVWVCVLETSTYDATKHSQLAGIRFEAAGDAHGVPADGDIALSVSAITVSGVSFSTNAAVFTLTAKAFIFDDITAPFSENPVIKDLTTNLSLSVGLAGANPSSFALTTSDGTESGSDMIVISYGATDPGAKYTVEIEVKPPLGAKVILTVEFDTAAPAAPIAFAGTPVALSMSVQVVSITATRDPASGSPAHAPLPGVDMVYHGKSRGLHWMVGKTYYKTEDALKGRAQAAGSLEADEEWFSTPICVTKGNSGDNSDNWRLPTLIELAGGVLPTAETGTEITARVNVVFESGNLALDAFDIVGLATKVNFLTLTVKAKTGDDDKGQLPDSTNRNNGYFAGMFNAGQESENQRGYPAHVHYDDTGNEVEISRGSIGKVVCVRETDSYEETPVWAEVAVDDGTDVVADANKAMVVLTAAAEMVKADLTVKLGLFNQRGVTAPVPVTRKFTALDLTVTRLDTGNTAFTIELTYEDGGAVVGVRVPQTVTDLPRTGMYTLSAAFAPAGDYFGLAQQRDFGSANRVSTNETQFYPVELVVDWTKPAVADVTAFKFAGVNLSSYGQNMTVTAEIKNTGFGDTLSPYDEIEMEYLGDIGKLRVMFSRKATPTDGDLFVDTAAFGNNLCAAGNTGGGTGWRTPNLSEIGMMMTPAGVTSMKLTVQQSVPGALNASASSPVVLDLPFADANGSPLRDLESEFAVFRNANGMRVMTEHVEEFGSGGLGFHMASDDMNANLGLDAAAVGMMAVCVKELAEYKANDHPRLLGVTSTQADLYAADDFPPNGGNNAAKTGVYTVTARAYYRSGYKSDASTPNAITVTGASLKIEFAETRDNGPFILKQSDGTTDANGAIITDGEIVIDYGANGVKPGNDKLEIKVTPQPQLGEAMTLTVRFFEGP